MASKEDIRKEVQLLNPIDDALFQKMAESKAFCQEILRVFLEEPDLVVIDNTPQKTYKNLQGRSIRVDLICNVIDDCSLEKTIVNVEVEKQSLDHHRRVRYQGDVITANITDPGSKFKEVPSLIIVYITKSNFIKSVRTKEIVERIVVGTGRIVDDGLTEIYINGIIDDGTQVAQLMKVFTKDEFYNSDLFPETTSLKLHYKTTEEGIREMYEIVEKLIGKDKDRIFQDGMQQGRQEERQEIADLFQKRFESTMSSEMKNFFASLLAKSNSEQSIQ